MPKSTSKYHNATELDQLTLGKSTSYISEYTPNLLQGVPRYLNRDSLNITDQHLPFIGEDVWYGYELSWLNAKGKPVVAVGEFRFPCTSPAIVESKSFKLYLNSLNQTRFDSTAQLIKLLTDDLSKTAGAQAQVSLFEANQCPALVIQPIDAICLDELDIEINSYDFKPELLLEVDSTNQDLSNDDVISENLVSHLLKSNCLITNQPDWASVYISYQGQAISHENLLRYLISFRQHNEFHEQCVERIFNDLYTHFKLDKLTVYARYTRRGGLDINPFRSTHLTTAPFARTLRQ